MSSRDDAAGDAAALVLVDADLGPDRRVQRTLQRLGARTVVVDLRSAAQPSGLLHLADTAATAITIAAAAMVGLSRLPRLTDRLRGRVELFPLRGMRASWRWLRRARWTARALAAQSASAPQTVVANDLYCAVAATQVRWPAATRLVYDSHELQIHRNRKLGWLRVLVEAGLEQRALRRVDRLIVVNAAIRDLMAEWYDLPDQVEVDLNDHYTPREPMLAPTGRRPVLVYVGMGVAGRRLDVLRAPAAALGFDVRLYLLGTTLAPDQIAAHWSIGPVDYEPDLRALQSSHRCLMWCCLDTHSLSYELATPNKFFQAIALGMPVVASRGTYLGRLVERHGIGVVLDECPLPELAARVDGAEYTQWVAAVLRFRDALRMRRLEV